MYSTGCPTGAAASLYDSVGAGGVAAELLRVAGSRINSAALLSAPLGRRPAFQLEYARTNAVRTNAVSFRSVVATVTSYAVIPVGLTWAFICTASSANEIVMSVNAIATTDEIAAMIRSMTRCSRSQAVTNQISRPSNGVNKALGKMPSAPNRHDVTWTRGGKTESTKSSMGSTTKRPPIKYAGWERSLGERICTKV